MASVIEYSSVGCHLIVKNRTAVSTIVNEIYCAIKAHTPKPKVARQIPTNPETITPTREE